MGASARLTAHAARCRHDKLPAELIALLAARRIELENELAALDGVPSVAAALRELRAKGAAAGEVRTAAATALLYVTNALRNPHDPRVHRIAARNLAYRERIGRLAGSQALMAACGFEVGAQGAQWSPCWSQCNQR